MKFLRSLIILCFSFNNIFLSSNSFSFLFSFSFSDSYSESYSDSSSSESSYIYLFILISLYNLFNSLLLSVFHIYIFKKINI